MITVDNLVFEYPTKRALHGVSFAIDPGTITALVGPNGAGKTTLLRCMAALDPPFSGRVTIDGIDTVRQPRVLHERVGYLQDLFGLYDALSVRQCLTYAALSQKIGNHDAAGLATEVATRLDLDDRLEEKAGELSRGLRQRLAIGQAIIHAPRVLMLDEPASGLDPEARAELSKLLVSLRDEGMTLLVSSHILAELEEYSTHMLVIRDGRIRDHQPIDSMRAAARRLRVVCSAVTPELRSTLEAVEGVSDVELISASGQAGNGDTSFAPPLESGAFFRLDGDRQRQAELLRQLIDRGFPVCEFGEVRENLQELYLASTRRETEPRA